MDRIWAPWRAQYITGEKPAGNECIFCAKPKNADLKKELVLLKGDKTFVLMNLYPYSSGHLMVAPYEHAGCITALPDGTLTEIMSVSKRMVSAMREVLHPDGFNMGFNVGNAAGAGYGQHLHFHIVPRWNGDANFMPVIGDTRVISEHIEATYGKLLEKLGARAETRQP